MRLFRRAEVIRATDFCCQDDGMVGLGPGARSYTRALHYSSEYAVGQPGVKAIIESFNQRSAENFVSADYGVVLAPAEQRIRYLLKSLLRSEGVSASGYFARFGSDFISDFPQLSELTDMGLAMRQGNGLSLTADGLSWSDSIGPWLYSDSVSAQMEAYEFS
jgi:oxygen-independent coproporphyrinogen-3 oxidase